MDIFPFQFYVGVFGFTWSVFCAGYYCGGQFSFWGIIVLFVCGFLCAIMAVARLNDVLIKELRQLRIWNGEYLQRRQEEAARRQYSDDEPTNPNIAPKAG